MNNRHLKEMMQRIDETTAVDETLIREIRDAIAPVLKDTPAHPEVLADPTEAVLHMIDKCLPGWRIELRGRATEPHGHWTAMLRETSDEAIGTGHGATVAMALSRALLKVAALKAG